MKNSMYKVVASLACAAILAACGGGVNDTSTTPIPPQPAFTKIDDPAAPGSGTVVAAAGDVVAVTYTGYLYDATKSSSNYKGEQFETNGASPVAMSLGFGSTRLVGWDKGLLGMKVGGKRTLLIPANEAFGASGFIKDNKTLVPANTAVVYEMTMVSITKPTTNIPPQPSFTQTDTTVGTGAEAAAKQLVSVHYTGYLYDETKADKKGAQFETTRNGAPFNFLLDVGSRIVGLDKGILGMKVGGKRTLLIPTTLAYSFNGLRDAQGNLIVPLHTAVVYEVELTGLVATPPASTVQPNFTQIDTKVGSGDLSVRTLDNLVVHYSGYFYNDSVTDKRGAKFDSSVDKGIAFGFKVDDTDPLKGVIAGWNQGVVGMKAGGKRTLIIPASLAYGAAGKGDIPPNAALIFDIEVLSITR